MGGVQAEIENVQPRLNRLEHGYPFVRAAMCGLMRGISTNIAILDMMRGAPSIYMLYLGYDEEHTIQAPGPKTLLAIPSASTKHLRGCGVWQTKRHRPARTALSSCLTTANRLAPRSNSATA